jgi:predicted transcriptional regulator
MTPRPLAVGEEPPPMYSTDETDRKASKPSKANGKAKGRFVLLNTFIDFTMGELSRADIIVWMILYRDSKEGIARTAQADIARRGKIDRRTVGRSLRRLAARGLLKIVHQGGFCRRGVSRYRVRGLTADPRGT